MRKFSLKRNFLVTFSTSKRVCSVGLAVWKGWRNVVYAALVLLPACLCQDEKGRPGNHLTIHNVFECSEKCTSG